MKLEFSKIGIIKKYISIYDKLYKVIYLVIIKMVKL